MLITTPSPCTVTNRRPLPTQPLFSHGLAREAIPARDLEALFQLCNERYFAGAVRPSPGFKLRISRSVKLFGCFRFSLETHTDWGIDIAARLLDHPLAVLNTMTHEMIHMLAHQRFRETGEAFYLDEAPLPGHPFENKGHGAFFLGEVARLNGRFPELQLAVKSTFGDELYERDKIKPVRLLMVTIDRIHGRGMIYRLHDKATVDWEKLRATARALHGDTPAVNRIRLCQVAGPLAEGFPALKKNNEAPASMVPVGLKGYTEKMAAILSDKETHLLPEPSPVTWLASRCARDSADSSVLRLATP